MPNKSTKTAKNARILTDAKPDAKPEFDANRERHDIKLSYTGSPLLRHGKNKTLSPIDLEFIPGSFSDRDEKALRDIKAAFGAKPFHRLQFDAGNIKRLLNSCDADGGYIEHVAGTGSIVNKNGRKHVAGADAQFQLTARGKAF